MTVSVQPHYSVLKWEGGVAALRDFFPGALADPMNFVLFSTSGVHGSYATIEDIEESLRKYPDGPPKGEEPNDWYGNKLTILIVQPRIVCMRYGTVEVELDDIQFLKDLRLSSQIAVNYIGED